MSETDVSGPGPAHARGRRRRRWALTATAVVVVLATGGVVVFSRVSRPPALRTAATADRATVAVTRVDLVEHVAATGTVGYGAANQLVGRRSGTLTWLPAPGSVVDRGAALYTVDTQPVPLLLGDLPMYRTLRAGVPNGPDVLVLERNLAALGYDVGRPDDRFQDATTVALRRWQKALKVASTGQLAPEDVVVLPGPVRVDSVTAQLAGAAMGPLLKVTRTDRVVSVSIDEAQRAFAKPGARVTVKPPGGVEAGGTVRTVEASDDNSGKQPKLDVTITFDDPGVATAAEPGATTVRFTGARRDRVLAVPVQALLALREGGYAVEVVDGGGDRLVAVKLGLFADGMVEVSGTGLDEGARVVTAS